VGVLGSLLASWLSLLVGGLAAVLTGWGLRLRPSPDARAWRRGAVGERRTARLWARLERQGWAVLHDLAVPGSRANLDHLVIGHGGVFVIDSKQHRGRLQLDPTGRLWHDRYPLAPILRAVSFEADQAARVLPDPGLVVSIVLSMSVQLAVRARPQEDADIPRTPLDRTRPAWDLALESTLDLKGPPE
jgi:hypothetical protein